MRLENCNDLACAKACTHTRRRISILFFSTCVWMTSAASARADDTVTLQRLEAQIQRLEARHESEIKALQAEIRRLRRQKPETVAVTQPPAPDQPRSSTAPSGVPAPALPAKVLMTYDRGYHFGFSDATGATLRTAATSTTRWQARTPAPVRPRATPSSRVSRARF